MSGDHNKMNNAPHGLFRTLYTSQRLFQEGLTGEGTHLPLDNPTMFQYHMTAMTEELGEVLKADKRWKTHRNTNHDPDEKLDEIADCFITMMNIGLWSGFSHDEIYEAIADKISKNKLRLRG